MSYEEKGPESDGEYNPLFASLPLLEKFLLAHGTLAGTRKNLKPFGANGAYRGPYSDEFISEAEERVARREASFPQEKVVESLKKLRDALELMMILGVNQFEWLGKQVHLEATALYDDYFNGIDAVADIKGGDVKTYLGLAIDVSVSAREIEQKLKTLERNVRAGNLSNLDFFHSPESSLTGKLIDIPRVVIGSSMENTTKLLKLFLSQGEDAEAEKRLREAYIQVDILDQIRVQLEKFYQIAGNARAKDAYYKALKRLEKVTKGRPAATKPNEKEYRNKSGNQVREFVKSLR